MKLMKSNKLNWFGRLQGNWSRRETGLAGKLVSQGNWSHRKTGLTGKLVSQGNWSHRETGVAGKLVSCYPC